MIHDLETDNELSIPYAALPFEYCDLKIPFEAELELPVWYEKQEAETPDVPSYAV
jgi:hypothetical protein